MKRSGPLISVLCEVRDEAEMSALLEEILTDNEWDSLQGRWRLMEMLDQGKTQREVSREMGVSLCKITRGSKILKTEGSISAKYIHKNNES